MEDYEDYNYDTECGSGCVSADSVSTRVTVASDDVEEDNYDTDGRVS